MKKLIICLLIFTFNKVEGIELEINYSEFHPEKSYVYQVFINSTNYVRIKVKKGLNNDQSLIVPSIQELYVSDSFSKNQGKVLVDKLIELGVKDWKIKYPIDVPGKVTICNGAHYELSIKSEKLNKIVSGKCFFPENYEKVIKLLMEVNKKGSGLEL